MYIRIYIYIYIIYIYICIYICIYIYMYIYLFICLFIDICMHTGVSTWHAAPGGPSRAIRAGHVVDVYGAFDDCSSAREIHS